MKGIAVLALLISVACSDSLFDAHGTLDASTVRDGADTPDGDVLACPGTCIGDSSADFDGSTNGANGIWRYLADSRDRTWQPLTTGSYQGVQALVTAEDQAPAIFDCAELPAAAVCVDSPADLVVISSSNADAALELTVPKSASYTLSGELTPPAIGSYVLRLYRNTRDDLLAQENFSQSGGASLPFSVELEAAEGDRLLLAITPADSSNIGPVGVRLFLSEIEQAFPGRCQLTLRFDTSDNDVLPEDCGRLAYRAVNDSGGEAAPNLSPTLVAGPIPELGSAMSFGGSDYLVPTGSALDYSGDFTVQMWIKASAGSSGSLFGDSDQFSDPPNGMRVFLGQGPGLFGATLLRPAAGQFFEVAGDWPMDDEWHFARIVRDTERSAFRLCIDDQRIAETTLNSSETLGALSAPYLGRSLNSIDSNQIQMDDVRILYRAMPCGL